MTMWWKILKPFLAGVMFALALLAVLPIVLQRMA